MPELSESLKINKFMADAEVENALYKRAKGYEVTEVVEEVYGVPTGEMDKQGRPVIQYDKAHRRTVRRQIPPDTTAGIFWLKNRQPEKWRDRRHNEISGPDNGPVMLKLSQEDFNELMNEMMEEDDC